MSNKPNRVNVLLDDEHAAKLHSLAERTYVNPGTIARSLLSTALDHADPDSATVTALLDAIPGAYERAQQGLREARSGQGIRLEDL
jgi:predicted transcriptional regulator